MANLKMGTLLGGNMIWHAGNMPLDTSDDVLIFKTFKVYHEGHKPTPADVGAVNKAGDTMTGDLYISKQKPTLTLNTSTGASPDYQARIEFITTSGQNVRLKHNSHDSMGSPFGLHIESVKLSSDKAYLRVEGEIYAQNNKQVYHEGHKPTPAELGVVNKAGDTMTGKLNIVMPGYGNLASNSAFDVLTLKGVDSRINICATADGTWGSGIHFLESTTSGGSITNWGIVRNTTSSGGHLKFNYGTNTDGGAGCPNKMSLSPAGDLDVSGKVLFGSQGQLVADSDEIYLYNSKVAAAGYRSFSLRDNGSPEFYSVTNGYKKIYHEGHKPSSSEITDLESKTAVSFKKAYHFDVGSTASGWTKIAHLREGSTGLRIQANISSHCSTFNNFKMDMTVNGRPTCFLGTFSQRLGSNPFGIVIYEIPGTNYPKYDIYAYISGYTQGLIEMSTLGIESHVDYPETLTYSSTKPVLPSGGSQRLDTTGLGSGLYTFAGNGYTSQQVYHQGRKPSPNEIGAVAKTGDVMTGRLQMGSGTGDTTSYYEVSTKGIDNLSDLDTKGKGNIGQLRFRSGNNGMSMGLVSGTNRRQGYIQIGHGDDSYAHIPGTLYIQPQGGTTQIGGNAVTAEGIKATWHGNYSCSKTVIAPICYNDGDTEIGLTHRGYLKVTAVINATSTVTGASAIYVNPRGSSWTIRHLGSGGTGSNHIEFIIDSEGRPAVKTGHDNNYTVTVVHEFTRMGSTGNFALRATGIEYRLSSPTINGRLQLDGEKIYTSGDKPTPADVGAVNKTGDTMTGDLKVPHLIIDKGNDYSSLRINNTKGSYGLIETTPIHDINLINRNTNGTNRNVWTFSDSGDFNAPAKILGSAVGISGEIGFGNMGHGAVQYPSETIQLGGGRNLRINFGANERMLLTNAGDLTVDAQMQATYTGSLSTSEQKNTKAAFYTEKTTGGSSEYHPVLKQKLIKTGSNAETWTYSFGQEINGSIHQGFYLTANKSSDSSFKIWKFKTNGNFDVDYGTIHIKGKEVYHEGHKPTAAELSVLSKTPAGTANEVYAPMTSKDDYQESPMIIRERGLVAGGQSSAKYSPNLCFHWGGRYSRSLYMPADGRICWGEYDASGTPVGHKIYHAGDKPTPAEIGAFNATTSSGTYDVNSVPWTANSGVYRGSIPGASSLVLQLRGDSASTPAAQLRFNYKNGGIFYRSARDSQGFEEGFTEIYTTKRKPTTKEIGAASTTVAGLTGASQWNHMCTVVMPQGASTVVIEIESGNGFNVGAYSQLGTQKIHIRTGNNNPKGINIVSYRDGQLTRMISDMGWKNTSGDTYEIYARAETYPTTGLIWSYKASSNASVTWRGNGVGTTQPAGITKWLKDIINYNTEYKPSAADVGAVSLTGSVVKAGVLSIGPTNDVNNRTVFLSGDHGIVSVSVGGYIGFDVTGNMSAFRFELNSNRTELNITRSDPRYGNKIAAKVDSEGEIYAVGGTKKVYHEGNRPLQLRASSMDTSWKSLGGSLIAAPANAIGFFWHLSSGGGGGVARAYVRHADGSNTQVGLSQYTDGSAVVNQGYSPITVGCQGIYRSGGSSGSYQWVYA